MKVALQSIPIELQRIAESIQVAESSGNTIKVAILMDSYTKLVSKLSRLLDDSTDSTEITEKLGRTARVVFQQSRQDGEFRYWTIEVYSPEGNQFPVGSAYVKTLDKPQFAQLDFIVVADQWRRQGFGTRLLNAIRDRWPYVVPTSGMDSAGIELLRSSSWAAETLEGDYDN